MYTPAKLTLQLESLVPDRSAVASKLPYRLKIRSQSESNQLSQRVRSRRWLNKFET